MTDQELIEAIEKAAHEFNDLLVQASVNNIYFDAEAHHYDESHSGCGYWKIHVRDFHRVVWLP